MARGTLCETEADIKLMVSKAMKRNGAVVHHSFNRYSSHLDSVEETIPTIRVVDAVGDMYASLNLAFLGRYAHGDRDCPIAHRLVISLCVALRRKHISVQRSPHVTPFKSYLKLALG